MIGRRDVILGAGLLATAVRSGPLFAGTGDPVVDTQNGPVRGRMLDGGVRAFTGIPYGAPPVGPDRFRSPRPAEKWNGVFDATRPAATPPQKNDPLHLLSEDCLQLDVWTPAGPGPHPVLFWIYGGGNVGGAINEGMYQGEKFARAGIMCVCVNYRLGVLGFLELGGVMGAADFGSGNNAIRDQQLGLRWVRDNISAFGGDPRRVTIAGQSAGAADCSTLLALPSSRGLFHQAILASGGGGVSAMPAEADRYAQAFVAQLGGEHKLRSASVSEILAAQAQTHAAGGIRPVIDGTFLRAQPMALIREGVARDIPMIIGHTRDEYRYFMTPERAAAIQLDRFPLSHFDKATVPQLIAAYAQLYPELSVGARTLRILGADLITLPTTRLAEAQTRLGASVHFYSVHYSVPDGPFGRDSVHGIDVPLIFDQLDSSFARGQFGYGAKDEPMARNVLAAWVSFIKEGRPTEGLPGWAPYGLQDRATMIVDLPPRCVNDPEKSERQVWDSLGAGLA